MVKNHYIYDIYLLAIQGFPAKKICSLIRRDKGQVSRAINAMISLGFLYCVNPRDRVKIYEATTRRFTGEPSLVDSITLQSKKQKIEYGGYYNRCHGLRYRALIKKWGEDPAYLDDQWETRGSVHYMYHQTFQGLSIDPVTFIRCKGRYSDTLSIIFPDRYFNTQREGDVGAWLFNQVRKVAGWFCSEYGSVISELRECSGVSHAIRVRHPELVKLAQERTIHFDNGAVLDASHGTPELEGPEDLMRELFRLPARMDELERRVNRIESSVEKIVESVDRLLRIFDAPSRIDDLRDVA